MHVRTIKYINPNNIWKMVAPLNLNQANLVFARLTTLFFLIIFEVILPNASARHFGCTVIFWEFYRRRTASLFLIMV
jgi:hypothetical protein